MAGVSSGVMEGLIDVLIDHNKNSTYGNRIVKTRRCMATSMLYFDLQMCAFLDFKRLHAISDSNEQFLITKSISKDLCKLMQGVCYVKLVSRFFFDADWMRGARHVLQVVSSL